MAQLLNPWILNAKGARVLLRVLRILRVLWAHLGHGGSHQNDFGLRNTLTTPSGALLRKTFVFDGAVARSLDPQC